MQQHSQTTQAPPPPIEPVGFFDGVKIRPIIFGVIIDYIATYVALRAYIFYYLTKRLAEQGELSEEAITNFLLSDEGLIIGFAIGAACTVLGGYVAGRRAGNIEVKHGAFVGLGSLLVSTIEQSVAGQTTPTPQWFDFLSYAAIIPAGALGGYVAELTKNLLLSFPSTTPDRRAR